ncbi:hypothetical protein GHT06_020041 [Daphnia sinensis]|uniref:Secreted protein n=1 Tax=Daphnia sinensis TaxID=1820382 RepID=A0AAD5KKW6_9CRUS|nr:hypothetical protein GHT06_020041 [Daphnia sinensis]
MTTLNEFAAILVAAIALLGTANGRVYQTSDSIVFEVDRPWYGAFFAKSFPPSRLNFMPIKSFLNGGDVPNWRIPFVEPAPSEVTPYSIGSHPQPGQNVSSWLPPSPVYGGARVVRASSKSGQPVKQESKQNQIACGAGPAKKGRVAASTESKANAWPFVV